MLLRSYLKIVKWYRITLCFMNDGLEKVELFEKLSFSKPLLS